MESDQARKVCGIVMPISAIDGCFESHWVDVKNIISDAISAAGFEANLVSDADEIGVIQKRIIQNLYDNPVVVCDVSAKNPNVMFELGLRLAFDKPTIIIKDDMTSYSFDTSSIEHLEYPRDLRYSKILEFKSRLELKIKATYEASLDSENYTTFLKHFGQFKVAKIDEKEAPQYELIMDEIAALRRSVASLDSSATRAKAAERKFVDSKVVAATMIFVPTPSMTVAKKAAEAFSGVSGFSVIPRLNGNDRSGLQVRIEDQDADPEEVAILVKRAIGEAMRHK